MLTQRRKGAGRKTGMIHSSFLCASAPLRETTISPCQYFAVLCLVVAASSSGAADAPWRSLALVQNGQLASDWQQAGWGKFVVEGEAIRTEPSEKGLGVLVYTKEKLGNCQIRI